jgi:hypothetical protein
MEGHSSSTLGPQPGKFSSEPDRKNTVVVVPGRTSARADGEQEGLPSVQEKRAPQSLPLTVGAVGGRSKRFTG